MIPNAYGIMPGSYPLIIILGMNKNRDEYDEFNLVSKYKRAYPNVKIVYYRVDLDPREQTKIPKIIHTAQAYVINIYESFKLIQLVFDIGDIVDIDMQNILYNYITKLIKEIRRRQSSCKDNSKSTYYMSNTDIGEYHIDSIVKDQPIGIYSSIPIPECWFRKKDYRPVGFGDVYTDDINNSTDGINWIRDLDSTVTRLFCGPQMSYGYYAIKNCFIVTSVNMESGSSIKYTYKNLDHPTEVVGKLIVNSLDCAIVKFMKIPEDYSSFLEFCGDIIGLEQDHQIKTTIEGISPYLGEIYGKAINPIYVITNKNNNEPTSEVPTTLSKKEQLDILITDYNDISIKLSQMIDKQKDIMNKISELLKE